MVQPLWKPAWQFFRKADSLTSVPATVLLGIYPSELNSSSNSREKRFENERILLSQLSVLGPACTGKEGNENYIHTPVRTQYTHPANRTRSHLSRGSFWLNR